MIELNASNPTHQFTTLKKLGRGMLLTSSGTLDAGNLVIRQRNRAEDAFEAMTNGSLAPNQQLNHELPVGALEYEVECLNPTSETDVALVITHLQNHDRK